MTQDAVSTSIRAQQEQAKHDRVLKVAVALPKVRRRVVRDLGGPGLTRERGCWRWGYGCWTSASSA
ncbi:hypothetical protein [Streptomyces cyaneofuscatus]|uniref:hypothetical protein n=1 Tax=Streptomyces cyaneofuscatus TaxID=66883 RepID=UPI00378C141C